MNWLSGLFERHIELTRPLQKDKQRDKNSGSGTSSLWCQQETEDMKIVILDPEEHEYPAHEMYTIYAVAKKNEFNSMDAFFFATVASGAFEEDERWYKKKNVYKKEEIKGLLSYGRISPEFHNITEKDVKEMNLYVNDWDDVDFTFSTKSIYGRVYWYTTA